MRFDTLTASCGFFAFSFGACFGLHSLLLRERAVPNGHASTAMLASWSPASRAGLFVALLAVLCVPCCAIWGALLLYTAVTERELSFMRTMTCDAPVPLESVRTSGRTSALSASQPKAE